MWLDLWQLRSGNRIIRERAAARLASRTKRPARVLGAIVKRGGRPDLRWAAVKALAGVNDPRGLSILVTAASRDPVAFVRVEAIHSMTPSGRAAVEWLCGIARNDPEQVVRHEAVVALAAVDDDRARAAILEWLKSEVSTIEPTDLQRLFGTWEKDRTATLLRDEGLRRLLVQRLVTFLGRQGDAGSAVSWILIQMGSSIAADLQAAIPASEVQTVAGISRLLDKLVPGWYWPRREPATSLDAEAGAALYRAGVEAMLAQRNEHALCCMHAAVYLDPTSPDAWCGCGSVLIKLSQPEDGLAHFERALALSPNSWRGLVGRGNCLAASDRAAEAVGVYQQALALEAVDTKSRAYGQYFMAAARADLGEWAAALAAIDSALELDPQMRETNPVALQLRKAIVDQEPHLYNSGPVHRARFAAHLNTLSQLAGGARPESAMLDALKHSAERMCFDNPQHRGAEAIVRWLSERPSDGAAAAGTLTQEERYLVSAVRILERFFNSSSQQERASVLRQAADEAKRSGQIGIGLYAKLELNLSHLRAFGRL